MKKIMAHIQDSMLRIEISGGEANDYQVKGYSFDPAHRHPAIAFSDGTVVAFFLYHDVWAVKVVNHGTAKPLIKSWRYENCGPLSASIEGELDGAIVIGDYYGIA